MKRALWVGVLSFCVLIANGGFSQSLDDLLEKPPSGDSSAVAGPGESTVGQPPASDPETVRKAWVAAKRQDVVKRAMGMVGQVDSHAGADGFKNGWRNLLEFYQVAYRLNDIDQDEPSWVPDLKAPEKFKAGNWSWCGIFCAWAWRREGLDIYWENNIRNGDWCPESKSPPGLERIDLSKLDAGDIIVIHASIASNSHHCIVKERNGNKLTTIDANQDFQSIIVRNKFSTSSIAGFYSLERMMNRQITPPRGYGEPPPPPPEVPDWMRSYMEWLKGIAGTVGNMFGSGLTGGLTTRF